MSRVPGCECTRRWMRRGRWEGPLFDAALVKTTESQLEPRNVPPRRRKRTARRPQIDGGNRLERAGRYSSCETASSHLTDPIRGRKKQPASSERPSPTLQRRDYVYVTRKRFARTLRVNALPAFVTDFKNK